MTDAADRTAVPRLRSIRQNQPSIHARHPIVKWPVLRRTLGSVAAANIVGFGLAGFTAGKDQSDSQGDFY